MYNIFIYIYIYISPLPYPMPTHLRAPRTAPGPTLTANICGLNQTFVFVQSMPKQVLGSLTFELSDPSAPCGKICLGQRSSTNIKSAQTVSPRSESS